MSRRLGVLFLALTKVLSPKIRPIRGLGPSDQPVANDMLSRAFSITLAFDLKADHPTVTVTSEHPDEDEWTRVRLSVASE